MLNLNPPPSCTINRFYGAFQDVVGNDFLEFEQEQNFTIFHLKEIRPLDQVPAAAFQNLGWILFAVLNPFLRSPPRSST